MQRHVPVHALPEAIQKMSRDQTVCKYCGISYLILHEFKVMEEKIKAMEKEIKFYEGSLEREKGLQEELQSLYQDLERCRADGKSKTERITSLTMELKTKQDELKNVKEDLRYFQEEKEAAHKQSQVLRSTLEHHCSTLSRAVSLFPFIRRELESIKEVVSSNLESWAALKEEIFQQIRTVSKEALTEIPKLNQKLAKSQRENECLQEKVKHLTLVADTVELKTQQLQTSLQQGSELQSRCRELQKETLDLTNQVETTEHKLQKVTAEMDHYKKLLMVKSAELDVCQNEMKKMKHENGISESRLAKELKEKEESLLICQQVCKRLQEEVAEKERKEGDLRRRTSQSESELETLKALLTQTEEEVVMLKQERELMLISHQNRTEQLQETLRQKMRNEDNWREKVEMDLAKGEARHKEAILKVREEARVELDSERQKQQELITKYQRDQEELQKKIPELISSATNSLRMEAEILEKKLQDVQIELAEKDQEKEKEIQSLKRLVTELEFQLKVEQNNNESLLGNLRKEIKHKSDELEELTQERTQLIHSLSQVQEENTLLQETVRRECEERYELTAALTQAREQVLQLRKLSGNLPLSPRSLPRGSLTSSPALRADYGRSGRPGPGGAVHPSGQVGIPRAVQAPAGRPSSGTLPALRGRESAARRRQRSQL
ncbi:leucine-, glutamate- and lysine-rich protein 1 isoform X1 [Lagopus leucura]|uniref:leucine-, glutamate- and lysine-rich protein 1 isoform X1 n=2 Tax=Lagopus leucura TaxID=30410 RepID=UPI001C6787C6|nr:leucine-, glutamate- and lysine-rich protein 1 isoform X1 [Lagopus leucura]XP_042737050.1 leucine-, glutamate- and lysine-rich protein 1 isoform X1 [Lagopus leucura]XP_042737051.1 leucine-, glutamate- and lysine-rich protein 1 isoform X1 [Lagopus leucura]XP_042737052.1 leucine-, glutamate- and lysine-rich protein 1 isoform X1 [Lagopus leucura]XP_042737053.1 leucine-, glutamate- and lysine-rich protein 1 isoform X1 [Lagopus leucura]XP_042737055.1 leucine-, glutamate- and lysine-rich protein 